MPLSHPRIIALLAAGALALQGGPAEAACSGCTCSLSATNVNFGPYNPLSTSPRDRTGNVSVQCNAPAGARSVSYDVTLSAGSGSFAQRTMRNGANVLGYNIYVDAARTIVWGNGAGGSSGIGISFTMNGADHTDLATYGRIPAGQAPTPGGYSEQLTLTLVY